ncbi:MAG: outer membrane beta-barrel protein [Bacteroidales bacterium]|nr:outer membrane beta-barrel protein [Bacteroidales bacterium]
MLQRLTEKYPRLFLVLLLATLAFLRVNPALGQEDCATKIQEAQKFYDQGLIDEIPQMLAPCMADGFTRVQKIEAYKLIILSYLFDDNQFEAEKTMLEFLKKYPEYEIMPNDPIEFVYLFESYRTTSVFSFGVTAGLNFTDPRIIEPFTTLDRNQATLRNIMKPGFQVGAGAGRYIGRKLLLNFEVLLAINQYEFVDEIKKPEWGDRNIISTISYNERLMKIDIPLSLAYEFTIKNMHYYARAGIAASKISRVNGRPERRFYEDEQPLTGEDENITDYRNSMLFSGLVGAGLRYKVPRGVVKIDLRANLGFNNIVNTDKRDENPLLLTKYYYRDDDFSLNTFSLSASYYFSFYSPKKQR